MDTTNLPAGRHVLRDGTIDISPTGRVAFHDQGTDLEILEDGVHVVFCGGTFAITELPGPARAAHRRLVKSVQELQASTPLVLFTVPGQAECRLMANFAPLPDFAVRFQTGVLESLTLAAGLVRFTTRSPRQEVEVPARLLDEEGGAKELSVLVDYPEAVRDAWLEALTWFVECLLLAQERRKRRDSVVESALSSFVL